MDEKINDNSKLKEFLGVMRPQSKSQTWSEEIPRPAIVDTAPMEVDGDMDISAQPSTTQAVRPVVQKPVSVHREVEREPETVAQVLQPRDPDHSLATDSIDPSTDADWMRSRTSRLLGLLDDDEEDAAGQATQKPEPEEFSKSNAKNDINSSLSESQSRAADAPVEGKSVGITNTETPKDSPDMESSERQAIGQSGRLFLRNLAYTITEDDLRSLFDPNHKVDEVSRVMRAQCRVDECQKDEHPDRDSLCPKQVMSTGKEYFSRCLSNLTWLLNHVYFEKVCGGYILITWVRSIFLWTRALANRKALLLYTLKIQNKPRRHLSNSTALHCRGGCYTLFRRQ